MVRCSCASENQVRYARRVFDGILLRKESAKATSDYDDLIVAGEVPSQLFNVVDKLFEGIRLGPRALAVPAEIE